MNNIVNATDRAAAVAHIAKMLKNEPQEWAYPHPRTVLLTGWNKCGMSPENRAAFVAAFGEDATAEMEQEAKDLNRKETEKWEKSATFAHMKDADENEKAGAVLKLGSFVWVVDTGLKFDHGDFSHLISEMVEFSEIDEGKRDRGGYSDREMLTVKLARIDRIEEVPAGFFDNADCLANWTPQEDEGGARSDDLTDEEARNTRDYSTFYTLGVLLREPSGRSVFIDPEGYDWPRYVMTRKTWKADFSAMVEAETKKLHDRDEAERREEEAKAEAAAKARAEIVEKYRKVVPFFCPAKGWHTNGEASRNLRAMLKLEFPGVKFAIRSDSYSGGCSVRVGWTDGPTEKAVESVVNLFEGGYSKEFGSYSYTFATRNISPENRMAAEAVIAEYFRDDCGWNDNSRSRQMWEAFGNTTIPEGAKVVGLEELPPPEGCTYSLGHRFALEVPKGKEPEKPTTPPTGNGGGNGGGVTVTKNAEKGGIEIRFDAKPETSVLEELKARRFRWSRFSKCWYNFDTAENEEFARSLAERKNGKAAA